MAQRGSSLQHPLERQHHTSKVSSSRRYNIRVPEPDHSHKHHRHAIYATETAGLLLIAFLLLILTVLRYWHDIHWSLR